MNPVIEILDRTSGVVLLSMPLYEFMGLLHMCTPARGEYAWVDLEIWLDGQEVLPCACGNA